MCMRIFEEPLPGMRVLQREVHEDLRGTFSVAWNREELAAAGVEAEFCQDNVIVTRGGALRGMHFQGRLPQGKLLTVLEGEVYDAAVDLRAGSPTFGRAAGLVLRASEHRSLWLPPGFAHGFLATSPRVVYLYKVTAPWDPGDAQVLAWDDPEVAVPWPEIPGGPVLSERDRRGQTFAEVRSGI